MFYKHDQPLPSHAYRVSSASFSLKYFERTSSLVWASWHCLSAFILSVWPPSSLRFKLCSESENHRCKPSNKLQKQDKGTSLRSGRVTHWKRIFAKICLFLLSTCVGHSSLSCGTLMSFISWQLISKLCFIGWSRKSISNTFYCSTVQQIHSNFKQSYQIDRDNWLRYYKIRFDTLNMLVTRKLMLLENFLLKCVSRPNLSGVPLTKITHCELSS